MTDNTIKFDRPGRIEDADLPVVVEFEPFLEAKGRPRHCISHRFVIDMELRQVSCRLCERIFDPIDALADVARVEDLRRTQTRLLREEVAALKAWSPIRRALRALDGIWRGRMFPCCPRCGIGLRPEDLGNPSSTCKAGS